MESRDQISEIVEDCPHISDIDENDSCDVGQTGEHSTRPGVGGGLGGVLCAVKRSLARPFRTLQGVDIAEQQKQNVSIESFDTPLSSSDDESKTPADNSDRRSPRRDEDENEELGLLLGDVVIYASIQREWTLSVSERLFRYFTEGDHGARRLLHDSVYFKNQREFVEFHKRILSVLQNTDGWIVAVHDESSTASYKLKFSGWQSEGKPWGLLPKPALRKEDTHDQAGRRHIIERDRIIWDVGTLEEETEVIPIPKYGHFHILHPCRWYNSNCRHLGKHLDVAKRYRQIRTMGALSESHVRNTLIYLQTNGKWLLDYKSPSGQEFGFVYRAQCLQSKRVCSGEEERKVEDSTGENEVYGEGELADSQGNHATCKRRKRETAGTSGERNISTENLLEHITSIVCYPMDHVFQTRDWYTGKYKYLISSDKLVKRCYSILQKQLMNWSYNDFLNHYRKDDTKLIFGAPSLDTFNDYYMSLEDSIDAIEELLDFQLSNISEFSDLNVTDKKREFVTDLWDVLEKKVPKKNTFQIISPPSAGKNFLLDAIFAFYWNVGMIRNFNKYESFPLMEAVDKRVNCWNEPNFEPSAEDTIKMILGGDPIKAAYKYESERNIARTPVIVMSNKNVFKINDAFEDRIITYYWDRAEFLRKYRKKVNPLIWPYLVDNYVKYEL
uniref:Nonstructural protein 1 n=1 Tax=Turdus hortulorum Iteradensovirus TaxID=2794561 RepID=A0A8A4XDT3_9VIRU|nr:MAG: nonstructural protein 1 [Turdus hortulorum Iteradensovirus]